MLAINLLGRFEVRLDGEAVDFSSRPAQTLLAYLLLNAGISHRREQLAGLLWPDSLESSARKNLRNAIYRVRQAIGERYLLSDKTTLAFDTSAPYHLDVALLEDDKANADTEALMRAVAAYQGELLPGFYEDWVLLERERLRALFERHMERLLEQLQAMGRWREVRRWAEHWIAQGHVPEPAYRALMTACAAQGDLAGMASAYRRCVQALEEEVGVPPSLETQTLYERLSRGEVPTAKATGDLREAKALLDALGIEGTQERGGTFPHTPVPLPAPGKYSSDGRKQSALGLPSQPTPFIGREQELADIHRLLVGDPDCRLLTLIGPGGIGKTRLAVEVASQVMHAFPEGVYFAGLASVSGPELIVSAVAEALNFKFHGGTEPKTQLLHHLREKELLLILDNFEHLLDGADFLSEILDAAPHVALLVTSRVRLNLLEEWSYEVQGLGFPPEEQPVTIEDVAVLEAFDAVQLFIRRARQANAIFSLSPDTMAHVVRICRLLDGMPLGLELAAPWVRTMTCEEIADEITRNIDFLATSLRNVPERHRSLKAVFAQTWEHLSEAEKDVLRRLSVFRGGCLREAAEEVAGATLPLLSSLVDKALLRRDRHGRFDMHELVRQFAEEHLKDALDDFEVVRDRHSAYYTAFLHERTSGIKGSRQKEVLDEIASEIDNVRAAWHHAVTSRDAQALAQAAECFWLFNEFRGSIHEGEAAFEQAVTAFSPTAVEADNSTSLEEHRTLLGFLLAGQGSLCGRRGGLDEGRDLMEEGISLMRQATPPDRQKESFALGWLGFLLVTQGNHSEAKRIASESLALFQETGDHWLKAGCLRLLGASAQLEGKLQEAEQYLQECLSVCREVGERRVRTYAALTLGLTVIPLGEYLRAKQLLDEAVQISRDLNDLLGQAYARRELGRLAVAQGEVARAVKEVQTSLTIFEEVGSRWDIDSTQCYLGDALRMQGRHEEAQRLYEVSLTASRAVGHRPLMARCLSGLGCLAQDEGKYAQAEQLQQEALAVWEDIDNEPEIASVLRHLGHIAVMESRMQEAQHYLAQALHLATKHRLAPVAIDVFVSVAACLAREGETERALKLLALAEHHPTSTYESKEKARKHLAELTTYLPTETAVRAQVQGRTSDWQTTASQLIEDLSPVQG
ncbi:MAG: tetratricopeptide repeat protein [Chloroflexota bacterium]|nr:tetratricopeptide repeat protein [Chloroflexota bacterium]